MDFELEIVDAEDPGLSEEDLPELQEIDNYRYEYSMYLSYTFGETFITWTIYLVCPIVLVVVTYMFYMEYEVYNIKCNSLNEDSKEIMTRGLYFHLFFTVLVYVLYCAFVIYTHHRRNMVEHAMMMTPPVPP
jgi:hypothetical protein